MYSLNKKKSKLSPADKNMQHKPYPSRNKSKTEHSPSNKISKDHIKSTINKILHQEHGPEVRHPFKEENRNSRNFKSRMEISIPKFRTSLTPKGMNYPMAKNEARDRQVQSTKAADNSKLFTSSGRYDFKQLFEPRQDSHHKESGRHQPALSRLENHSGFDLTKHSQRKFEETTVKFQRDNEFDVKSVLTAEEFEKFGDRFPDKFKRIALLGRGGFSVVWLGVHRSSKRKVAVKQILTKNPHETHLKEIWFGSYFFEKGGDPREQFQHHIGINNICKLYSFQIKSLDSWLYYEVCEQSLGSSLYELKNEVVNGEKTYRIIYKELMTRIKENINELKILVIEISKALYLINSHNIVHSDLKTENILLRTRRKEDYSASPYIKSLKLIDFGSSFLFTNLKQFSMATPEYMPPEILNYILFQNKLEYDVVMLNKMEKYTHPWIIDVWSVGCIVLEIVTGIPLWMSLPTRIQDTNIKSMGIFAAKGRIFHKIIEKQIEVVKNLDYYLFEQNHSGIVLDKKLAELLKKMLSLQPQQRISPFEILTYFGVDCQPQKIPFY